MANSLLKLLVFLSGMTALREASTEPVEVDQACYSTDNTLECSQHQLQCQQGTIFILKAAWGFKQQSSRCHAQRQRCPNTETCCRHLDQDCLEDYTKEAFSDLAAECWSKVNCTHRIPSARRNRCSTSYESMAGYSVVRYLCLQDEAILNFRNSTPMIATSMALHYRYSADKGSYAYICNVEAEDCTTRTVDITLVKSPNDYSREPCTTLSVNHTHGLPCDENWGRHATYLVLTPFTVKLEVFRNNDVVDAWALIHDGNLGMLRVTCRWEGDSSFPSCSSPTIPSSAVETTFPPSPIQTAGPSPTTGKPLTAAPQPSPSSIATAVTSSAVTADDGQHSPEGSSNTSGKVGGVVGAVLVVLMLVVVIAVYLLDKHRRHQGKDSFKVIAWFKRGNSRSSHPRQTPAAMRAASEGAASDVTPGKPAPRPSHINDGAAATAEEAGSCEDPGSDYDHLRQKPTSLAPRDVTYGHLGGCGDISEYGYARVIKGKGAGRSGEVVNNVYDIAGPAVPGCSDEDPYSIASGAHHGRRDIINNVYHVAQPASAQDTEGVEDYEISGDVSIEFHDVNDSPYELAKAVN